MVFTYKDIYPEDCEVFVLTDSELVLKKISDYFRQLQIIPQVFFDLNEFWQVEGQKTAFLIIDILKVSCGEIVLKDHPLFKNQKLKVCFLYEEKTRPLLKGTFPWDVLGHVLIDPYLSHHLDFYFHKYVKELHLEKNLFGREAKVEMLQNELNVANVNLKKRTLQGKWEKDIFQRFEEYRFYLREKNFHRFCDKYLDEWDVVKKFSLLEIAKNGQKIFSPSLDSSKYVSIGSLWPTKVTPEFFGPQEINICRDYVEKHMGSHQSLCLIPIGANPLRPQMLLYCQLDLGEKKNLESFPKTIFETLLSRVYCYYQGLDTALVKEKKLNLTESHLIPPWEMLQTIDQYFHEVHDFNYQLMAVDFGPLISHLTQNPFKVFAWKNYFEDFIQRCLLEGPLHFQFSFFGVHWGVVLTKVEYSEALYQYLSQRFDKMDLKKYMDDLDEQIVVKLRPTIEKIPCAVESCLGLWNRGQEYKRKISEKTNLSKFI